MLFFLVDIWIQLIERIINNEAEGFEYDMCITNLPPIRSRNDIL